MGSVQYFDLEASLSPWVNAAPSGEAFANLRQRNQLASLTNIGMAALLWTVSTKRFGGSTFGVAAVLAIGNAATTSRIGLVGLVVLLLLAICWGGPTRAWRLRTCCGALCAYGLSLLVLPRLLEMAMGRNGGTILNRLAQDLGCSSRTVLWSNVLDLIAQKPWFGWGWGELDYAHYSNLYSGERFCDILDNAHNLPLHLAVELGVPFAMAVCGAIAWLVWRGRPWREADPTRQLAWGVLAVIGVHSLVEYPLWYGPFQMAVGLCIWMLWTHPPVKDTADADLKPNTAKVPVIRSLFAIMLIAFVGYAGWDYHRISQLYLPPDQRAAAYRADALGQARQSWLFRNQVAFAELTLTPLTRDNAAPVNAMATQLLHYSPEPRVIEKVIESAVLLQRDDEALWHLARYRAAFPKEHAAWVAGNARGAARAQ
jgi:Virulence factor membrane-bound polymerase, C-terminal/O-Antigen ligase/Protein glycosylation ligase